MQNRLFAWASCAFVVVYCLFIVSYRARMRDLLRDGDYEYQYRNQKKVQHAVRVLYLINCQLVVAYLPAEP